jgi:transcriptional regulator with XRE-family HTH domain
MAAQSSKYSQGQSIEAGRLQIADFFRTKRLASRLTLEHVSAELGLNGTQTLLDYESGAISIPLDEIFALTNLLNVAPEEVMALILLIHSQAADRLII